MNSAFQPDIRHYSAEIQKFIANKLPLDKMYFTSELKNLVTPTVNSPSKINKKHELYYESKAKKLCKPSGK